ncbi:P-loop containing nucleoside triphosphate hydrolase protein [Trichoderma velutinum]
MLPQTNADLFNVTSQLPEEMNALYNELRSCVGALSKKKANNMINPTDLVNSYCTDNQLKWMIDKVVASLPFPMFLPITRNMITQRKDEEDFIDVTATVLAHAVQILLFAPTGWNKDIIYQRDSNEYTRRYPTPPGHGGDCRAVAGVFSLEDLHRSVLLVYLTIYRRSYSGNVNSSRGPQPRGQFLGYFDVLTQKPTLDGEADLSAMQLATTRLLDNPLSVTNTIVKPIHTEDLATAEEAADALKTPQQTPRKDSSNRAVISFDNRGLDLQTLYIEKRYGWKDPDEVLKRLLQHTISFTSLVEERKMLEFSEQGASSPAVQEIIVSHPDQEQGFIDTMRRAYALGMVFNGNPPPEDTDLLKVCKRFGISWPEMQVYKDIPNSQPLKPHQIADLGVIFDKLDSIGHVLLCNDMGLGKTKVYAAMVECRARDIETKAAADSDADQSVYFPTLVVNPVSTIHQTHTEFKQNFPGLNVLLYYASKSQARKFGGAKILEKGEFLGFLQKLSPTNPMSGRTVILTTYSTLHRRDILRVEERFVFEDREQGGPPPKRQRTEKNTSSNVTHEASFEDEADGSDDDEVAQQRSAHKETNRIRTYYKGDPDLNGKRLEILAQGDERTPDGILAEYRLQNEDLGKIRWGFLIMDEAHTARKVSGVTGTPLMSSLHDIMSPLILLWTKIGIKAATEYADYGNIQGLWRTSYDPDNNNQWEDGSSTLGVFTAEFKGKYPPKSWDEMEDFYKRTGVKIWQLNPVIVEAAGRKAEWSSSFGQNVVSAIFGLLALRRCLRSRLVLPNGTACYPGAELPPMTIATEELNFDSKRQSYIRDHGRICATNSFLPGPAGENFNVSQEGISSTQHEGSINFSAYREGVLVAYDCRNSNIIYSNVEDIFGADMKTIENAITAFRDGNVTLSSKLQRHGSGSDKGKGPIVGVEHLQRLLSFDQNAGLDYFFSRACLDPDVNSPAGRSGWLNWLCATSPILSRCLELTHRYVLQDKERIVVYVDTRWIQQLMFGAMKMAGFHTLTVRSADKPSTKNEAVRLFCDPTSEAQVFIANINMMSMGVNLHTACCKGFLVNMPFKAKTILQIHGRLNRLGQKNAVKWHNLKVKNSFHDHQERILLTKWSRQLSAETSLPKWISGALREVVLFELMKAYMNHPFNRYAWLVFYDCDGPKMEYYTQKVVKLGHACSALARLVMTTDREQYWTENDEVLMVAMLEMTQDISLKELETWLTCGEQVLRHNMKENLERFITIVKWNEAKKREAKKQYESDEVLFSEDLEGESEHEDEAEESADEEFPWAGDE